MTSDPVDAYYHPAEFRIGPALSRAFEVLFGNFFTFFVISAVATLPGIFLEWNALQGAHRTNVWLSIAVRLTLVALCEAMILYATFQALRGRPVRALDSVGRGLQRFFPVIGAAFLTTVIIAFGYILLVIPGLIAAVMLALTLPVCVVERLGPVDSISRSVELTRGYRWHIFGAFLIVGLVAVGIEAAVRALLNPVESAAAYLAAMFVVRTLFQAYETVLIAIIYHDLRVIKDGIDLEHIASVFD